MEQSAPLSNGELIITYRLSQSALEFHFDAKSSLLRQQSIRPVVGSSATSQLGNGVCAHHPFDHL
jgi:hypothetical protein